MVKKDPPWPADDLATQQRVKRRWIWTGRFLSPLLALAVYFLLGQVTGPEELSDHGRLTAAVGTLIAGLWITEAMPLPVTALLPILLFPALGILSVRDAAAPYASPPIFLFMGGFMLALAMERWNLHRRIALHILRLAGRSPAGLLAGFIAATAFLSMWISNTATAVMMVPIVLSVVGWASERLSADETDHFASALLLAVAYAASIGGSLTLVGTPPNVLLAAFARDELQVEVSFGAWMLFATPLGLALLLVLYAYMRRHVPDGLVEVTRQARQMVRDELRKLGPLSRGEKIVLAVFVGTATLWMTHEWLERIPACVAFLPFLPRLTDEMIAVGAAMLLFVIPVDFEANEFALDWETAVRLPWGVLLIFGGGLSLARAVSASGLDDWIASQVAGWGALPAWLLTMAIAAVVVFATEMASNTATASAFLPILAGAAEGIGVDPLVLLVPATVAASYAFMLPAGTPPNAIVFGTGYIPIRRMARVGFWMNLAAIISITAAVSLWMPLVRF